MDPDSTRPQLGRRSLFRTGAALLAGFGMAHGAPASERGLPSSRSGRPVILQPSWVLAMQGNELKILADHDVIVVDDLIHDVRPRARRNRQDHRFDMTGQLLTPGFIAGHRHSAADLITRGISESRLGDGAFRNFDYAALVDELDTEDIEAITQLGIAEAVLSGVSTILEMSSSLKQAKSFVKSAQAWGIRSYPSVQVPGYPRVTEIWRRTDDQVLFSSVPGTLAEINEALRFAKSIPDDGRTLPMMAIHDADTHTDVTVKALLAAAVELGNGVQMHLASNRDTDQRVRRLWRGLSPVQWLASLGVFDAGIPAFAAHLVAWTPATDAPLLASKPWFTFCQCPSATLGGQQPWPEALAAGINACIGFDGRGGDFVEKIKQAVQFGQLRELNKTPTSPPMRSPSAFDGLAAATIAASTGLRRSDLGRIDRGCKADLTAIRVDGPQLGMAGPAPANHLLYASGRDVQFVMIDGEIKVANRTLLVADQDKVLQRAHRAASKIWRQAGIA